MTHQDSKFPPIIPDRTALIVHDMQNGLMDRIRNKPGIVEIIQKVKSLLDVAHKSGTTVVYTKLSYDEATYPKEMLQYLRDTSKPPPCVKGMPNSGIIPELTPSHLDHVIEKIRSSCFYSTALEVLLRSKSISTLLIVGGSTNVGVEWLARDAKTRDFIPVVIHDCTYASSKDVHEYSLRNIEGFIGYTMNSNQAIALLSS